MNFNKLINRTSVKNGLAGVLLVIGIVAALVLLGIELIGASHLAAFINYLRLN